MVVVVEVVEVVEDAPVAKVVEDVAVAKVVEVVEDAPVAKVVEVAVVDTGKWSEALAYIINKIKESWLIMRHC